VELGVAAPAVSAAHPLSRPGGDVCQAVASLTAEVRERAGRVAAPTAPRVLVPRRRVPVAPPASAPAAVPVNGAA
jgi:hypothetical protein